MLPIELYKRALEADLLGPLRRDAQIPEEILTQVKLVFLALPAAIQARILLTAVQHPSARISQTEQQEAAQRNGERGAASERFDLI